MVPTRVPAHFSIVVALIRERHLWERAHASGRAFMLLGKRERWMRIPYAPVTIAPVFVHLRNRMTEIEWIQLMHGNFGVAGRLMIRKLHHHRGCALVIANRFSDYRKDIQNYVDSIR